MCRLSGGSNLFKLPIRRLQIWTSLGQFEYFSSRVDKSLSVFFKIWVHTKDQIEKKLEAILPIYWLATIPKLFHWPNSNWKIFNNSVSYNYVDTEIYFLREGFYWVMYILCLLIIEHLYYQNQSWDQKEVSWQSTCCNIPKKKLH